MGHELAPAGEVENRAEKVIDALKLRQVGHTYREIAAQLFISVSTAHVYVDDALKDLAEQSTHEAGKLRVLEMSRLDEYMLILGPRILAGDMNAIDRAIKINESRRKLLGIDVPVKSMQISLSPEEVAALTDDELDALIGRLGATGTGTPAPHPGTSTPEPD